MSFCSETTHWRQEQEPNREDVRTGSMLMCFVLFAGSHVTSHLTASSKPLSSFEEAVLRIFLDFGGGEDSSSKSLPSFFFLQQGLKFFARDLFRVFENDACERRVEKFDFLRTKIVHRECDREGNIPDIKLMTVFEGTSSSGWKT